MNNAHILLLLILLTFTLTPTASLLLNDNTIVLDVLGNGEYMVFIDVLYPDGFKNIGETYVKGHKVVELDISDVKEKWNIERALKGRYASLTLRIVVYGSQGLVNVYIRRIDFNEIIRNRIVMVNIENQKTNTQKTSKPYNINTQLASMIRVLEDSYECNKTVIIAMFDLDNNSYGVLNYLYPANGRLGFTVYLLSPRIELAGWVSLARNKDVILRLNTPIGGKTHGWMTFRYRWEKWIIYSPETPDRKYEEQYVYIIDFYPSTAETGDKVPSDVVFSKIDAWKISIHDAARTDLPYFQATLGARDNYYSIDLISFTDTLLALGKITTSIQENIYNNIPVIGVNPHIEEVPSTIVTIDLYPTSPGQYKVSIGEAQVKVNGSNYFPTYYLRVVKQTSSS